MDNQVGFLKTISIVARDIPDAWFQCVFNILDYTSSHETT
jgi:hypothetical protein